MAIAVIVVLAVMASGALGRTPTPAPVPSTPPSAQPSVVPLAFSQRLPYPNTDAMGADRVLVLDFDHAVDASDISASFSPAA